MAVLAVVEDEGDRYREKGRAYRESLTSHTVEKWPQLREIGEIRAGREGREGEEHTRAS